MLLAARAHGRDGSWRGMVGGGLLLRDQMVVRVGFEPCGRRLACRYHPEGTSAVIRHCPRVFGILLRLSIWLLDLWISVVRNGHLARVTRGGILEAVRRLHVILRHRRRRARHRRCLVGGSVGATESEVGRVRMAGVGLLWRRRRLMEVVGLPIVGEIVQRRGTAHAVRCRGVHTAIADRPWPIGHLLGRGEAIRASVTPFIIHILIAIGNLVPASHADIAADADSAALLGDEPAEGCALGQTREFLCAEDGEGRRLHLQTEVHECAGRHGIVAQDVLPGIRTPFRRMGVGIFGLFELLVQTEVQSVLPLVTDGEVWEDEVARRLGTIEVCDAGHGGPGEGRHGVLCLRHPALRHGSGMFQRGEEEEIGIVGESDVVPVLAFVDMEFDDRRRVHWPAICRCWGDCQSRCRLEFSVGGGVDQNIHLAPEPHALARSGCWITSSSYSNSRPSLVTRLTLALVSFETGMMLLGMLSGAEYWIRFLGSAS